MKGKHIYLDVKLGERSGDERKTPRDQHASWMFKLKRAIDKERTSERPVEIDGKA